MYVCKENKTSFNMIQMMTSTCEIYKKFENFCRDIKNKKEFYDN